MKVVNVRVVPNAKKNEILEEGDGLTVYVAAPPIHGKANKAMVKLLAEFFKVRKSDIRIIRGEKSREKIVEVDTK
jgi:uncharacterized protein (TIGR00251 family)